MTEKQSNTNRYKMIIDAVRNKENPSGVIWKNAELLNTIVKSGEYMSEYTSMTDFARSLGISKATLSQYCHAVEFAAAEKIDKDMISFSKAYLLSTLGIDYKAFVEDLNRDKIVVYSLSQSALKKRIHEWTNGNECREGSVSFNLKGERYRIPYSVLREYKI